MDVDKKSATGPVVTELTGPNIPADVEDQVKLGNITAHTDANGVTHYYKPTEGGQTDATTERQQQEGGGTELPRTEAGQAVPEDTGKGGTQQSKPADDSDSAGAKAQVPVVRFVPQNENGVWVIKEFNPLGEEIAGADHGYFTGDQGEARAKEQADFLNKKYPHPEGPDIGIAPQDDGTYHVVDQRLPAGSRPITIARTLKDAQDKKKDVEDAQAKSSGMTRADSGVWVYDVPTQNAINRMQAAVQLRDSGQPIPDTTKSLMESDYADLKAKGVDMTPFERPQSQAPTQEAPVEPLKESPPDTTSTHNTSIEKLLSPADWQKHQQLEAEWGALDDAGIKAMGNRDKLQPLVERQIQIRKEQRAIESKLPGGDVQDVIVLGSGNAGIQAANSAQSEGLRATVLEAGPQYGGATNETILENIGGTNPYGDKGSELALNSRLRAMKQGAQFEKVRGIAGEITQDPDTKIWTVKTLGPGPNGEGGKTFQGRTVVAASGVVSKGLPFEITDSNNNVLAARGVTGSPQDTSGVKLYGKATPMIAQMRAAKAAGQEGSSVFIGGANSAVQGAVMAAESGAGPVHLIYRAPYPDASDYLRPKIDNLVKKGKLILHPDEQILSVEKPSDANGNRPVVITNKIARNADGSINKNAELNLVRTPTDVVGQYLGGRPAGDFLPSEALKSTTVKPLGAIITNDNHQVLKRVNVGITGAKANVPIDGLYAAGTVRQGAQNRLPSAVGEGSDTIVHVAKYLLDNEKDMPKWKQQLRDNFNSQEFGAPGRGRPIPENVAPGGEPAVDTTAFWKPATEYVGQKKFVNGKWVYVNPQGEPVLTGGKVGKPAPTSVKPKPEEGHRTTSSTDSKPAAAGTGSR